MQVRAGELLHDRVQQARLVELGELVLELELLEDVVHVPAEVAGVIGEVRAHVLRVAEQAREVEPARVVERVARHLGEHQVGQRLVPVELCPLVEDGLLRRGEHLVEASEDRERQRHVAVLGGLIGAAQALGDVPDELNVIRLHLRRCPLMAGGVLRDSYGQR